MNRICNGSFFKVNGINYYRCLEHGGFVNIDMLETDIFNQCSVCLRPIGSFETYNDLKTRKVIINQIKHPDHGWIDFDKHYDIVNINFAQN